MKKEHIIFICKECGYENVRWLGRCPQCNSWNSFVEFKDKYQNKIINFSYPVERLDKIFLDIKNSRIETGISEFDRILGGGIVSGSVILVGGEPGVGKSTLMLQVLDKISSKKDENGNYYKTLYVSSEESLSQIKLRANRLNINNENILVLSETNLEKIIETIKNTCACVVVIDSIQTISSDFISNFQGSVTQIRGITAEIIKLAKSHNISFFILGHVTKEGEIAGPKLLEHMVDVVFYFECDISQNYRILRVYKNRFGSTLEIAIFEMTSLGLKEIKNPSEFFIQHDKNLIGTVTTCIIEGTRPILTQVQALLTKSYFSQPRRVVSGLDYNRCMLLISVLEKHTGINLAYEDIYLNIVSGLKTKETSVDLAIIVAIYSSYKDIFLDSKSVYFGEIGLNGELRQVSFINERINEILKLGYRKIFLPYENKKNISQHLLETNKNNLEFVFIKFIKEIEKII